MEKHVSKGSSQPSLPHQGGVAPVSPKVLGPRTCVHTARERVTKFYTVIKLDVRKMFTPYSGQYFW